MLISHWLRILTIIMRPSSLGGGRILRRTLSVCPSVPLSSVMSRHLANYNDTHVLCGTRRGPHIVRPSRPHKLVKTYIFWKAASGHYYLLYCRATFWIVSIIQILFMRCCCFQFWILDLFTTVIELDVTSVAVMLPPFSQKWPIYSSSAKLNISLISAQPDFVKKNRPGSTVVMSTTAFRIETTARG